MLAYVFVKKTLVNAEMIRNGYARAEVPPPNLRYRDVLLDAQKTALRRTIKGYGPRRNRTQKSIMSGTSGLRHSTGRRARQWRKFLTRAGSSSIAEAMR